MSESPSSSGDEERGDRDPVDFGRDTPPLEWAVAGLGVLVAVLLIGALVYDGIVAPSGPAAFGTEVIEVVEQGGTTLLRVEVTNDGGEGASAVIVHAVAADETVGEAVVGHLPSGATETVGLLVSDPVLVDIVEVRVAGFTEP